MLNRYDRYDEIGVILVAFPAWTPQAIKALSVKERKYWAKWGRARLDRNK